jgi:hypothetical protein
VPNPGGGESSFLDVAAPSASSAWAVGGYFSGHEGGPYGPVVEHWDGSHWAVVRGVAPKRSNLASVTATGADDVWIAGSTGRRAFITHWDGQRWTPAVLPTVGGSNNLREITAISPTDVWAVGAWARNLHGHTLMLHWDGHKWAMVSSPTPAPAGSHRRIYVELDGVAALSSRDVWAVGSTQSLGIDGPSDALIEHWDGRRWMTVTTPQPTGFNQLFTVSAASPIDVWAFGDRNSIDAGYGGGGDHPLSLHWDGHRWRVVGSPPAHKRGIFYASLAISGMTVAAGDQARFSTLISTRVGQRWAVMPSRPGTIAALAAEPAGSVWAVGAIGRRPLALRC